MMNEWDIANSKREAAEEARAEGEAKGKAEGLAEGEAKGKEAVATNLLKAGVPVKTIVECTGLSEAEVLNLKK